MSSALSVDPIVLMQWWIRPGPRRPCAISNPRPSPRRIFSTGTRTSWNITSAWPSAIHRHIIIECYYEKWVITFNHKKDNVAELIGVPKHVICLEWDILQSQEKFTCLTLIYTKLDDFMPWSALAQDDFLGGRVTGGKTTAPSTDSQWRHLENAIVLCLLKRSTRTGESIRTRNKFG